MIRCWSGTTRKSGVGSTDRARARDEGETDDAVRDARSSLRSLPSLPLLAAPLDQHSESRGPTAPQVNEVEEVNEANGVHPDRHQDFPHPHPSPSSLVRLKICCISSLDEARLAIDAGAHALGLVSAMPSGPGPIAEERIAEISARVPPGVATFLLTSRTDAAGILAQLRRTRAGVVQLV